ncbi:serine/threonine protein kinase [Trichophyton equinum CBS 127.97]|uniref:Serine/threonine protein kinase n=1 Tax=Trichophyton equinum (strain ATCC MYA-4606 / CBS 127.97) TaxID=559882 RepID=F2PQ73_TRIEC|nr:serine/threonine protein kinase [Trichophyton equinum CBS 127.97]
MASQKHRIYIEQNVFGNYEALSLRFLNIYGARDITTEEMVFLKFGESPREKVGILNELNILRNLAGVPGVPNLRWLEVTKDWVILATDPYGLTVEELFSSTKRCLELDTIHSKSIVLGGFSSELLAIGGNSWQQYQIFVTNFERARKVDANNPLHLYQGRRADLEALGMILVYLLSDELSWDDFQRKVRAGTASITQVPDAVLYFISQIPTHGLIDYST